MDKQNEELRFSGRVLDNVHGFIYFTEAEERIMDTLLFKRLQSIKQLSVVNWVFPGSEHTRYIHSLGVMFIADKMAEQLELTNRERKIVRIAGLLHDIGHYPLSHVCEYSYKNNLEDFPAQDYCKFINVKTKRTIDALNNKTDYMFMKKSTGMHHEQVGADIVLNNKEIRDIIIEQCGDDAPDIIADMITGNVDRGDYQLLVQILHSELDADGIDYLMRDAMFSGTSFGAFELEQLIGCMCKGRYNNKDILCIGQKGIAAADQYLINKFFSYSQVVFNKHISVTEWMAEQIVNWMQRNGAYFPKAIELKKWINKETVDDRYIDFTDNYFWGSLQDNLNNQLVGTEPDFIRHFCSQLLHHSELEYEEESEIKIVDSSMEQIRDAIQDSDFYKMLDQWDNRISILSTRRMSKQIHQKDFDVLIAEKMQESSKSPEKFCEDDGEMWQERLRMECICVREDNGEIHLLCDDNRSLMRQLYNTNIAVFRTYKYM